jgi:hypothetical protein
MPQKDIGKVVRELRGLLEGSHVPPHAELVDPNSLPLFGGLSGVSLEAERAELLPGLELHQTYAHMFAPPMVAFAPPPNPRMAHPAPWHPTLNGGLAETVRVELRLSLDFRPFTLSRVETLRLVAGLIRLLAVAPVRIAVLSDIPFAEVPSSARRPNLWQFETVTDWPKVSVKLNEPFLELVRLLLQPASLILSDDDVYRAFALADGVWWLPTLSSQMTTIWTAAETLMRPGRMRTGEELAKAIRAYIGKSRGDGDRIYNEVTRLYGARGSTAHAGQSPNSDDVRASFLIVREILLRAIAEGARPPLPADIISLWQSDN